MRQIQRQETERRGELNLGTGRVSMDEGTF